MSTTITEPQRTARPNTDVADFARSLEVARELWKRYPQLVESSKFHEPFLTAFREDEGREPGEVPVAGEKELIASGLLKPKPAKS